MLFSSSQTEHTSSKLFCTFEFFVEQEFGSSDVYFLISNVCFPKNPQYDKVQLFMPNAK
jgi:hypothetical protein